MLLSITSHLGISKGLLTPTGEVIIIEKRVFLIGLLIVVIVNDCFDSKRSAKVPCLSRRKRYNKTGSRQRRRPNRRARDGLCMPIAYLYYPGLIRQAHCLFWTTSIRTLKCQSRIILPAILDTAKNKILFPPCWFNQSCSLSGS